MVVSYVLINVDRFLAWNGKFQASSLGSCCLDSIQHTLLVELVQGTDQPFVRIESKTESNNYFQKRAQVLKVGAFKFVEKLASMLDFIHR